VPTLPAIPPAPEPHHRPGQPRVGGSAGLRPAGSAMTREWRGDGGPHQLWPPVLSDQRPPRPARTAPPQGRRPDGLRLDDRTRQRARHTTSPEAPMPVPLRGSEGSTPPEPPRAVAQSAAGGGAAPQGSQPRLTSATATAKWPPAGPPRGREKAARRVPAARFHVKQGGCDGGCLLLPQASTEDGGCDGPGGAALASRLDLQAAPSPGPASRADHRRTPGSRCPAGRRTATARRR
jgi:hypothetical protein